jgi:hypothetical protein
MALLGFECRHKINHARRFHRGMVIVYVVDPARLASGAAGAQNRAKATKLSPLLRRGIVSGDDRIETDARG